MPAGFLTGAQSGGNGGYIVRITRIVAAHARDIGRNSIVTTYSIYFESG
jgi:hypothetical protein